MPGYELPPDLSAEQERAILTALERALAPGAQPLSAWSLAGRAEGLRLGTMQIRHQARGWTFRGHVPFVRRGTSPLVGRGDAK